MVLESAEVDHIFEVGIRDPNERDDEERLKFRVVMHNVFVAFANGYRREQLGGAACAILGLARDEIGGGKAW